MDKASQGEGSTSSEQRSNQAIRAANEEEVRAKADAAIAEAALNARDGNTASIKPIWDRGIESEDLRNYVKVRSTTMSFPEKVRVIAFLQLLVPKVS